MNRKLLLSVAAVVAFFFGCEGREQGPTAADKVSLRLMWTPQAQFAGYLVADSLGFYAEEGLEVEIRPAGPDIKPHLTVASGTDDFGVGVSNQVITARSNDVPLKIIAQIFQDSANRYVVKQGTNVARLEDLQGKRVGLWLGGDEAEFVAMLKSVGMDLSDVIVVPQGFSVAPFLNGEYVLSQVTVYNELLQIRRAGLSREDLYVFSPAVYQSAIVGDMLFTSERLIRSRPEIVRRFVKASVRGWAFCITAPEECVNVLVQRYPDLDKKGELEQLTAVRELILAGNTPPENVGIMKAELYSMSERVLFSSGQITRRVSAAEIFDDSFWKSAREQPNQ